MSSPGDTLSLKASESQSRTLGGGDHGAGNGRTFANVSAPERSRLDLDDLGQELPTVSSGHMQDGYDSDITCAEHSHEEQGTSVQDNPTEVQGHAQAMSLLKRPDTNPKPGNDESTLSHQTTSGLCIPNYPDSRMIEYLDPTPKTPRFSPSSTPEPGDGPSPLRETPNTNNANTRLTAAELDGTESGKHDTELEQDTSQGEEDSKSEIQSILDQFGNDGSGPDEDKVMSPRKEIASPMLQAPVQYPPRKSSLEPVGPASPSPTRSTQIPGSVSSYRGDMAQLQQSQNVDSPNRTPSIRSPESPQSTRMSAADANVPPSPQSTPSLPKSMPPEPDAEPDLPFDFHRFLEQLRHRTADPVAKFLRSFLVEFGKKQWMVHEQVKIISDFLAFITNKMAQCEVWRGVSEAEFDNAKEGMEKLVMNRLYTQTFSPAIPPPAPLQEIKGKKKDLEKVLGPARKGQHQEDIERDDVLGQKVRIYGWVQEEHLDIQPVSEGGRRFLHLAQQEILKIKTYRAPRDKIICVLNCCKVIFGLLRNSKSSDTSADSFIPLLIYVVLRANPEHLVSNVQYILRFRSQEKLGGEAGYYLSSLMGAIQFIESLDRTSLTISDEDFERNVEAAVSVIAEKHREPPPPAQPPRATHVSEKSGLSEPEIAPRNSTEVEYAPSRRSTSFLNSKEQYGSLDGSEESSAVNGLLRTIQKPLSSIGRMFSDDQLTTQRPGSRPGQGPTLQPEPPRRLSPAVFQPPRDSGEFRKSQDDPRHNSTTEQSQMHNLNAEDAAALQASAEAAEAQRIQRNEHNDIVETLAGMFPDLDRDIIDDVVRVKQGRVGLAVDACLALSS